jgi:hypothetical protein
VDENLQRVDDFLEEAYLGQDRMTDIEIQKSAMAAELPAALMTLIDALPEGMYTQDEASEALRAR